MLTTLEPPSQDWLPQGDHEYVRTYLHTYVRTYVSHCTFPCCEPVPRQPPGGTRTQHAVLAASLQLACSRRSSCSARVGEQRGLRKVRELKDVQLELADPKAPLREQRNHVLALLQRHRSGAGGGGLLVPEGEFLRDLHVNHPNSTFMGIEGDHGPNTREEGHGVKVRGTYRSTTQDIIDEPHTHTCAPRASPHAPCFANPQAMVETSGQNGYG